MAMIFKDLAIDARDSPNDKIEVEMLFTQSLSVAFDSDISLTKLFFRVMSFLVMSIETLSHCAALRPFSNFCLLLSTNFWVGEIPFLLQSSDPLSDWSFPASSGVFSSVAEVEDEELVSVENSTSSSLSSKSGKRPDVQTLSLMLSTDGLPPHTNFRAS